MRMKPRLADIAAPEHTAIVTQECQGGVIGPHAGLALLAEEARRVALPNIVRLLPAARTAGVRIVHCLVQRRPDGLGANHNAKIFAIGRNPGHSRSTSLRGRPERPCFPS
jgi:nicotinamidase-related amidase